MFSEYRLHCNLYLVYKTKQINHHDDNTVWCYDENSDDNSQGVWNSNPFRTSELYIYSSHFKLHLNYITTVVCGAIIILQANSEAYPAILTNTEQRRCNYPFLFNSNTTETFMKLLKQIRENDAENRDW